MHPKIKSGKAHFRFDKSGGIHHLASAGDATGPGVDETFDLRLAAMAFQGFTMIYQQCVDQMKKKLRYYGQKQQSDTWVSLINMALYPRSKAIFHEKTIEAAEKRVYQTNPCPDMG